MRVDVKFCGMTRAEDVAEAVALGAAYIGVVFAGGPRQQTMESAAALLAHAPRSVKRVGVVSAAPLREISQLVHELQLDVLQVHADPNPGLLREIADASGAEVWAVMRIAGAAIPSNFREIADAASAIVLDSHVPGGLGGTGVRLPWRGLAGDLESKRRNATIALAGGLRSENVAEAIAILEPDIVDVSSGVESAPGIKDHNQMRAFMDAARGAGVLKTR